MSCNTPQTSSPRRVSSLSLQSCPWMYISYGVSTAAPKRRRLSVQKPIQFLRVLQIRSLISNCSQSLGALGNIYFCQSTMWRKDLLCFYPLFAPARSAEPPCPNSTE